MSEKMYPIPFKSLMNWIVTEYAREGEIFGVHTPYYATGKTLPIFGETIETPFGPAAGPNSQLAQNIIAAYFAGARFFEVKTVQKMDGEELARCVPRPCILAADEGYITNVAVFPEQRRRGIAGQLLQVFLNFAEANRLAFLTLEVRPSNAAAIALYQGFGFQEAGRRKNYYDLPKEDALILTRRFDEEAAQ